MYEADEKGWKKELDGMYDDPALCRLYPEILFRTVTDEAARKTSRGIKQGRFSYEELGRYQYGLAAEGLSEKSILEWVGLLAGQGGVAAIRIALGLFYFVHHGQRAMPRQPALDVLLHDSIMTADPHESYGPMDEYHWKMIGLELVRQHPGCSINMLETVVRNMGKDNFFTHFKTYVREVLGAIVRQSPAESWRVVAQYVGPPADKRAHEVLYLLRGGLDSDEGMLASMPVEDVISWAGADERRPAYIARLIPRDFGTAREFLARFGDRDEVSDQIMINFDNEGWSGSAITHYAEKKKKFALLREGEKDPKVAAWLDRYIGHIERDIERSRDMEERELQAM